jgi:polyhydroxyalkanoate synthase
MQQDNQTQQPKRRGPMPIMMHLALMALSPDKVEDILKGLHNYHHHPYDRNTELTPLPSIWSSGSVHLRHAKAKRAQAGRKPILIIPSFINGSEILDLTRERSLIRWLAAQGHDCYLLDWGDLTQDEHGASLSALITERAAPALTFIKDHTGQPPALIGYCLGGNFAAALAALHGADVSKLVLLATPWDFHHPDNKLRELLLNQKRLVKEKAQDNGALSAAYLQSLFIQTDLKQSAKKYANFGKHAPTTPIAKHFVATEDWVNGGEDLPARLILECIDLLYKKNVTQSEKWQLTDGKAINIQDYAGESLVIAPFHDQIVPHGTSSAITSQLSHASCINVDSGHIGMIVGRKAEQICWQPIYDFLNI